MRIRAWRWSVLGVVHACVVGDPIVYDNVPLQGFSDVQCGPLPACIPIPPVAPVPPMPSVGCIACAASEDADCSPSPIDDVQQEADCTAHQLTFDSPLTSERRMLDVSWSRYDLTIASAHPLRVVLDAPSLRDVRLTLRGPVELVITDSKDVMNLEVHAEEQGKAAPSLRFEQVEARGLTIDGAAATRVSSRASVFGSLRLNASVVSLESTALESSELAAGDLTLTDVRASSATINADSGTLSATKLIESALRFCGETTIVKSDLMHTKLTTCDQQRVRIYDTQVTETQLDGYLELDASSLTGVRFGASASTDLVGFVTYIDASAMCDQTRRVALDSGSTIRCSGCPDVSTDTPLLCSTAEAPPRLEVNKCTMFMKVPPPPLCEDPRPSRIRP